jgi:transcriptional regulator with XRE-family HTH domain
MVYNSYTLYTIVLWGVIVTIGEKIRELRERKGWSQAQLALAIGKTRVYVTRLEADQYKAPGSDALAKLAKALEVSEDTLLEAMGAKAPREPVDAEIDDLVIYLHGKNPDAKTIRQLKRIAETLFAEEEEGKGKGARGFD